MKRDDIRFHNMDFSPQYGIKRIILNIVYDFVPKSLFFDLHFTKKQRLYFAGEGAVFYI